MTAGNQHDLQGVDSLLDHLTKARAVLADKAYDADQRVRGKLQAKGCKVVRDRCKKCIFYFQSIFVVFFLIHGFYGQLLSF